MMADGMKEVTPVEIKTVKDIAFLAQCSPKTVRKLADDGLIESRRNYKNWRIFPNPEQAAQTICRLLLGEATSDEMQKPPDN